MSVKSSVISDVKLRIDLLSLCHLWARDKENRTEGCASVFQVDVYDISSFDMPEQLWSKDRQILS